MLHTAKHQNTINWMKTLNIITGRIKQITLQWYKICCNRLGIIYHKAETSSNFDTFYSLIMWKKTENQMP